MAHSRTFITAAIIIGALLAVGGLVLGIIVFVNRDTTTSAAASASASAVPATNPAATAAGYEQRPSRPAVNPNPQVVSTTHFQNIFTDRCDPCDGLWPLNVVDVDYLIIGGGPAGLATADDLAKALRANGVSVAGMSVAVVEKRAVFGGNLRAVDLLQPSGYSSTAANGYGKLRGDLGAQRINLLTLTEERRRFAEHNITVWFSPFKNIPNLRDRRMQCRDPIEMATTTVPYYYCAGVFNSTTNVTQVECDPAAGGAFYDVYSFGDFCTYDDRFTAPETGAYPVRVPDVNFTGCRNYDNTEDNRCNIWPSNDPSYDAYGYLLNGLQAPAFDEAVSGSDYYFFGGEHPLVPGKGCNTSKAFNPAQFNDTDVCPAKRCSRYADWRSFVAGELSVDYRELRYNDAYANFLEGDNFGFSGDYMGSMGACSYAQWMERAWNEAGFNGYPKGGMTSLTDAMKARAQSNGVDFYANEPAKCIKRAPFFASHKYEVRTATKTFRVKNFLFLAAPTPALQDRTEVAGNVLDSLDAKREFKRARSATVASVVMQWAPGQRAWFWDYFDEASGHFSVRTYGQSGCAARIELLDTPLHRCSNAIRAVYSDDRCSALWEDLITKAKATGNWTKVRDRVLVELRDAFPEANVTAPVLTSGDILPHAWHWAAPEYDDISNEAEAIWAAKPLGNSEPLCLVSESVHTYYSTWAEGALRSSRQCLSTRFTGSLKTKIDALYAARDASVPGSGWWDDGNFATIPLSDGVKAFANEVWGPYDYSGVGSTQFCRSDLVVAPNYPVTNIEW